MIWNPTQDDWGCNGGAGNIAGTMDIKDLLQTEIDLASPFEPWAYL